ncbi:DNA-binding transcriptional regulator [Fulvivirgaceae bacterium BMA12]|uniref:DNA-binding transcriptional regulator n=1 Tax=Agaribacillus aureus TaxID=3051825 RepID=A0ABT8L4I9_9BACT|nr:DNA-binding transcriptional regulator [Fulvivirgaceae bacterium BMA12]
MKGQFRNKTFKKHLKVALLMETSNEYARGIIRGIYAYIKEHGRWDVFLGEYSRGEPNPEWMLSWKGDGIIARIENKAIAELVSRCNLPTVDISAANLIPGIPWVETDDKPIARLAADHLVECGFKNFGFAGTGFNWSKWRGDHFSAYLTRLGLQSHFLPVAKNTHLNWLEEQENIQSWLTTLPKPIGIFAGYDLMGRLIIDACNKLGYMVPEEVAVIGVDNDPLICELCSPPLSSIIPDTHKTGYVAASLLESIISKKVVNKTAYRIKPLGVKKRRSTDTIAIDDPYISKAMNYIFENANSGTFNIDDILSFVPMSRRVFEKKFKKIMGRTPYKEMQRIRVNRIKELLGETDLTLLDIAERAGFEHVSYMSYLFKRETGMSPVRYRDSLK